MLVLRDILTRELPLGRAVRVWTVAFLGLFYVLIHVYSAFYGSPNAMLFRTLHVGVALALVFLYLPLGAKGRPQPGWLALLDWLFVVGSLWISGYFMLFYDTWEFRKFIIQPIDYFTSILTVVLVLEATRRAVGMSLVVICLLFCVHALFANYFPVPFFGPPSTFDHLLVALFFGDEGVFGTAVAVMAQFVVVFILFGTLLTVSGGGAFFSRISFALFGHLVGGPAKAAVVSSGMMGMLSGSAVGNVVTTGTFTIPLMKRMGYGRSFAGGVAAAASNGGVIMPPVMGAVAFIMAEFLNRPYVEIALAAAIPAVLYYVVIYVTVHFEARKLGLAIVDRSVLPRAWPIFRDQGYMLIPLALIIAALFLGYSIVFVASVILLSTFALALVPRVNRMTPIRLYDAIEQTARSTVGLSATAAAAGIIIGAIFATGLSFTVSQWAVAAAQGQIWLILIVAAVMAFIMGLGMTAAAVYITMAATVIPILTKAGVPDIAAHFFAFYWGNISNITPPVAFTAFAAAPIAGANPMTVGWQATRLGAATFLLPALFIYAPALLLEGPWHDVIHVTLTAGFSLVALALCCTGYVFTHTSLWQRAAYLGASVLLIAPSVETDLAGGALLLLTTLANWWDGRRNPARATVAASSATARTAAPQGPIGQAWARYVAGRMEKEADGQNLTPPPTVEVQGTIAEQLMTNAEGSGSSREVSTGAFWIAWAGVAGAAFLFEVLGQVVFHARHPIWWIATMAAISLAALAILVLAWKLGRVATPAGATPQTQPLFSADG
jgi:TRAP transporter 4TM/12TM fusion protein